MIAPPLQITLATPDESADFARALGRNLTPGDCILFAGPIGAGKSLICRHLIQSLQDVPEDVPSPTFTLVQSYDTRAGEVWHADLYRLGNTAELAELGLDDAMMQAICLIEWPDRLGDETPDGALTVSITPDPADADKRHVRLDWSDPKWPDRLAGLGNG